MDVSKAGFFRTASRIDERTFEVIFTEHYAKIYAVLFRLTGDRDAADDLTSETFWRLWEKPPGQNENLAGWLYRVATRLGYNALRASKRREHYETQAFTTEKHEAALFPRAGDGASDPASEVERRQERRRVRDVLRQMPERDVQVLILRHSGLSYKEIAAVVNVTIGSVGKYLSRAEIKFEALYRQGDKDAPKR